MEKILTISVAAYNVEDYIEECLQSLVIKKNFEKLEVIIVNDGSTDNTLKIVTKFCKKFPTIFSVIDKDNGGWGSTLNSAIKSAKGKYFKQLDGDDFYDSNNLDSFIDYLENCEQDVIYSPFVRYNNVTKKIKLYKDTLSKSKFTIDEFLKECPNLQMHACTFKTRILKSNDILLLEHCFYTDQEYLLKALYFSNDVSIFDKYIYCYRIDREGQSVSLSGYINHRIDHQKVILELCEWLFLKGNIKDFFTDRLVNLSKLHFRIYINSGRYRRELKNFDLELKKYPIFKKLNEDFFIKMLRLSNYLCLPLLSIIYKIAKHKS